MLELEEAEEERMLELNRQVSADLPLTRAETEAWRRWILLPPRRRKRKKRRKKLSRTSSNSSCGGVRRRQWQRHAHNAGVPGDVTTRAVFPSVVVRPEMLGIMACMDQKYIPRVWCAHRRLWQWHVQGWFCWYVTPRAVFLPWFLSTGPPLGLLHGWFGPEEQLRFEMVVVIPVIAQRLIPMVQLTVEIPQLQFLNEVIDVPGMQVVQGLPSRLPVVSNDRCPP